MASVVTLSGLLMACDSGKMRTEVMVTEIRDGEVCVIPEAAEDRRYHEGCFPIDNESLASLSVGDCIEARVPHKPVTYDDTPELHVELVKILERACVVDPQDSTG